jgi:hypothetical protein
MGQPTPHPPLLSLFDVGHLRAKTTISVVVMAKPRAFADRSDLRLKIAIAVGTGRVAVEFIPGAAQMLQPPDNDTGVSLLTRMRADGLPEMGSSIGIVGELGGGTRSRQLAARCMSSHYTGPLETTLPVGRTMSLCSRRRPTH